ncbi:conserved hypothetical protein [[Clostridium] ultunense Esp]|nr:conserved hypothetical protein [[Clostridium] ultunense Esp]
MFIENTEELAQNKLLLLYIIDRSEKPLTNEQITEFMLENNYMNYFLIQQYLSELINSSFIEYSITENKKTYKMLDKGKATLSYFEDRIPKKIKEEIANKFSEIKEDEKKATQVLSEFFQKDDAQFIVNLKLVENDETLFSLYINVATAKQAEKICHTWENNTEHIYKNVLNMLVGEEIASIEARIPLGSLPTRIFTITLLTSISNRVKVLVKILVMNRMFSLFHSNLLGIPFR